MIKLTIIYLYNYLKWLKPWQIRNNWACSWIFTLPTRKFTLSIRNVNCKHSCTSMLFIVSDVDSNKEMFISGCFGCRLNVWSFPSCERIHSIKACHPINCVSIEQNPKSATGNTNSGSNTILAATCSRTGRINSFSPNVVLWNVVTGECLKRFDLPSACFVQVCIVDNPVFCRYKCSWKKLPFS